MITGPLDPPHLAVHPACRQLRGKVGAEQEVVQMHAFVVRPAMTKVAPEGPQRPRRLKGAQGVRPALVEQGLEGRAALWSQQGVVGFAMTWVDVRLGGDDVVVAGQDDGDAGGRQLGGVSDQPIEPGELVGDSGLVADCRWAGRSRRSAPRSRRPRCSGPACRLDPPARRGALESAWPREQEWPPRSTPARRARRRRNLPPAGPPRERRRPPPSIPAGRPRRASSPQARSAGSAGAC